MKKGLVVLVVLLCASFSWAAPQGEKIGKVQGQVVSDELARPRIEIDSRQMSFSGSGAYWLRDNLAAMLRVRIANTGLAGVAVTGRQYDQVTRTQDRIHGGPARRLPASRYSAASRSQVPMNEMIAPTATFILTGRADIDRANASGGISINGYRVSHSGEQITATVGLFVEPVNAATGLNERRSYEVTASASRTVGAQTQISTRRSSWGSATRGAAGSRRRVETGVEDDLLMEAASRAVDQLLAQFQAPQSPPFRDEMQGVPLYVSPEIYSASRGGASR
jgi:hypothetical protein